MDIRELVAQLLSLPLVETIFLILFVLAFFYVSKLLVLGWLGMVARKARRASKRPERRFRQKPRKGQRSPKHHQHQQQAIRCLDTLASIPEPGRKFAYLRKVNAYTFEEMVLEGLERQGHQVKRNERYSGDGGIDGRVWIDGQLHLVQSKRYAKHISAAHLMDFTRIVREKGCKGIFVHTGRTGKKSWSVASPGSDVTVISGQKLLDLLIHDWQ